MFQVLLASLWPSWWGLGSSLCAVSATAYGAVGLGLSWAQTEKLHPFLLEKYGIDLHKELGKFEDFEKLHGEWLNRLFDTLDEDADGLLDRDEVQNGICEYLELILKDVLLELGAGDESSMAHITFRERCQERILGQYSFDDDMEENERPSKIRHVLPQYQEDINKLTAWCFKKCDIDHDKRISRSECHRGCYEFLKLLHHGLGIKGIGGKCIAMSLALYGIGGYCLYRHVSNAKGAIKIANTSSEQGK